MSLLFFHFKNFGFQLIADTVQRFPCYANTRAASTGTLSTLGVRVHHDARDTVRVTIDTRDD